MQLLLKNFLLALVSILVLDAVFIGLLMMNFFQRQIGDLMGPPRVLPALLTYILLAAGLAYFVTPHLGSASQSALNGAFLGLLVYGVYELTNLSILAGWTPAMAVVDIIWGVVLSTTVSLVMFYLG